jgi:putative ABC transport system permease protein
VELDNGDVARAARLGSVRYADPNVALWNAIVRAGPRTRLLTVFGVTENAGSIRNFEAAAGRLLSPDDVATGARVAFLGAEAASRLFGREPAVGRTLQVESVRFRVVGVAARKGAQLVHVQGRDDEAVLVPYTAAQRWLHHDEKVEILVVEAESAASSWLVPQGVRQLLGLHHAFDPRLDAAMGHFNLQEAVLLVTRVFAGVRLFLAAASVTTLLVGAVGVMNIMLVVVGERRREIGLRKAVGAPSRAIFAQFLCEAAAISLGAGILGAALGLGLVQGLAALLPADDPNAAPPWLAPGTAFAVGAALALTAIASSLVPALRAARVAPAESLRAP